MLSRKIDVENGRRRRRGFSLLEILIVLALMALIVTLVGPRMIAQLDRGKVTAAKVQARSLVSSLKTMRIDLGRYPTAEEGLALLTRPPAAADSGVWLGPYIEGEPPTDPWGNPYVYEPPASFDGSPRVISLGGDGRPGGSGTAADIASDDPR